MSAADILKQTSAAADQRAYEPSMEEILASIRRIIADDQSLPNRAFVRDGEAALRAALDSPETPLERDSFTRGIPVGAETASVAKADVESSQVKTVTHDASPEPSASVPTTRLVAAGSHGHIAAPQYAMPDSLIEPIIDRQESAESIGVFVPQRPSADKASSVASASDMPLPALDYDPRVRSRVAMHGPATNEEPAAAPEPPMAARAARAARTDDRLEAPTQESETRVMPSLFSSATDQTVTAAFNTLAASRLVENDDALKNMVRDMIRPLLKSWLDDNLPTMVERLVRAEIERVGRGGR